MNKNHALKFINAFRHTPRAHIILEALNHSVNGQQGKCQEKKENEGKYHAFGDERGLAKSALS